MKRTAICRALLILAVGGCKGAANDEPVRFPDTHPVLLAALRDEAARERVPFDSDSVRFQRQQSEAVPGLAYHWGEYRIPGVLPVSYLYAVSASRGGDEKLVRTAQDWGSAVERWVVSDSSSAVVACAELVQTTRLRQGAGVAPLKFDTAVAGSLVRLGVEVSNLPMEERMSVVREDGRWTVTAWYLLRDPAPELIKFECVIPLSLTPTAPPAVRQLESKAVPSFRR